MCFSCLAGPSEAAAAMTDSGGLGWAGLGVEWSSKSDRQALMHGSSRVFSVEAIAKGLIDFYIMAVGAPPRLWRGAVLPD
jgi:hypothetical protein